MRARMRLVEGTEVRPRRALAQFWRWEQTLERTTRDMPGWVVGGCGGGIISPKGQMERGWREPAVRKDLVASGVACMLGQAVESLRGMSKHSI